MDDLDRIDVPEEVVKRAKELHHESMYPMDYEWPRPEYTVMDRLRGLGKALRDCAGLIARARR